MTHLSQATVNRISEITVQTVEGLFSPEDDSETYIALSLTQITQLTFEAVEAGVQLGIGGAQ